MRVCVVRMVAMYLSVYTQNKGLTLHSTCTDRKHNLSQIHGQELPSTGATFSKVHDQDVTGGSAKVHVCDYDLTGMWKG